MRHALLFLVCWLTAFAQQSPQQDPFDAAFRAVWQARSNGRSSTCNPTITNCPFSNRRPESRVVVKVNCVSVQ